MKQLKTQSTTIGERSAGMLEGSRAQLVLLATSHGMNHAYQLLMPIIMFEVAADYKLSNLTAGILFAFFNLSYSLLPLLFGYLARVFSRRLLLALGFAVSAFAFLAMGFVDNIAIFALLLFIAGVGGSTYHPNGISILADTCPTSNRGQTLGLHQTGGAIGSFIGPVVAGVLVLIYAWRATLMIFAIPGVILAVILWFSISPEQPRAKSNAKQGSRSRFSLEVYGSAILLIIAGFIYAFGRAGTDNFAPKYFTDGRGINPFEASLLFATLKAAGLFSAPLCGRLSDVFNRKRVLIALVIVESVSLYAITVTSTTLLAVPCLVFGFASFGLLGVGEALLADITSEEWRSTFFGAGATLSFAPAIFLPPILGGIADVYSFDVGFILLSALMLLSIPLILKVKTKPAQQNKKLHRLIR